MAKSKLKRWKQSFLLFILATTYSLSLQTQENIKIGIQPNQTQPVYSIAVSSSGEYIASGGADKKVHLWNAHTGQRIRSFEGHEAFIRSVVFHPDNQTVISGSADKTIRIWEISTGRETVNLEGHTGIVYSIAIDASGRYLVSGSEDKTVRLWDIKEEQEINKFTGHTHEVMSVAIDGSGEIIVSGSDDYNIRLWDRKSNRAQRIWHAHKDMIRSVTVSPSGEAIISGGLDGAIRLWKPTSRKSIKSFGPIHDERIHAVTFSRDGQTLLAGGEGRKIYISKINSGPLEKIPQHHHGTVFSLSVTPDGKTVVSGSGDGTIKLWDLEKKTVKATLVSFKDGEWVSFTPDNYYTCSPAGEQHLYFMKGNNRQSVWKYAATFKQPDRVAQNLGGRIITTTGKTDNPLPPEQKPKGPLNRVIKKLLGKSRSWAVLIGINDYSEAVNGFGRLPYAVRDAEAVKKYLVGNLGFSKEHVFTLYNKQATKKNIERLLFDTLRKKIKEEDRLLVYYSGHGQKREEKTGTTNGFLIPFDGSKEDLYSTCISMKKIKDLSDYVASNQILFLIDSCFSGIAGTIHRKGFLTPVSQKEIYRFVKSKGFQVMTAGSSDETAFMGDEEWNNHSVYTYYLLKGLRGAADLNRDRVIWAYELHTYLISKVGNATDMKQTPQLFNLTQGEGQFVFYEEADQ